ncbi:hypothetical protein LQF60_03100 [Tetragenococcus koreensis]|uniref:hypothetical protein n=1 Tax=Tetragenococcus koreensis TaxID=290335 RepID=UPI000F4E7F07|nr:hypothetical protein [Tetragenococcus koreensis]AYW46750.1 hypothetical protein C7K43_12980 [Tetragenococcus koreensis]MCF1585198.1 hypothetical protein [Tetragenococcus koreensis]MCF1614816.1 hypothetical protein [Tetragenococcus koreensis]MCF1624620.1 hypothetical protein [Tetragenococcus koreensis]MCF1628826.1 hypothetical protein [Tetragenococcus koreensis]
MKKNIKVKLSDLFTSKFMKKYTKFNSIDSFVHNYDSSVTAKTFKPTNNREFDKYVSHHSKFKNWNEMYKKAGEEYLK